MSRAEVVELVYDLRDDGNKNKTTTKKEDDCKRIRHAIRDVGSAAIEEKNLGFQIKFTGAWSFNA